MDLNEHSGALPSARRGDSPAMSRPVSPTAIDAHNDALALRTLEETLMQEITAELRRGFRDVDTPRLRHLQAALARLRQRQNGSRA